MQHLVHGTRCSLASMWDRFLALSICTHGARVGPFLSLWLHFSCSSWAYMSADVPFLSFLVPNATPLRWGAGLLPNERLVR